MKRLLSAPKILTENGFGKEEQVRLARVYKELSDKGILPKGAHNE